MHPMFFLLCFYNGTLPMVYSFRDHLKVYRNTISGDAAMNRVLTMLMVFTQLSNTLCFNKINFKTLNKVII